MKDTKQKWFKEAKYGLFIHWGLFSILAGEYKGAKTTFCAEWIMNTMNIPVKEYEKLAGQFNPQDFDADQIVKQAKDWGMRYLVFTTKHHDGFAMFDSACDDYNVVKATPYGKDVLMEFRKACDKYGMKLCLYYSQAQDWHDPNGYTATKDNDSKDYKKYLKEKCMPQIRELLTNYGEISMIWFDTPMDTTVAESAEIVGLVKKLQPNCLVSGRIGNGLGDYMTTGDNNIPRLPFKGDFEVPATLNDTWGYSKFDHHWKDAKEVIRLLIKINNRGGNYLLNIGPDGNGHVPEESVRILNEVGEYVRVNHDAIYGTKSMPIYAYEMPWCDLTCKKNKLFVHVFEERMQAELYNLGNHVRRAYILGRPGDIPCTSSISCEGDGVIYIGIPEEYHHKTYYCICIELEEEDLICQPIKDC